ncbi:MAG TPA: hypothetical protein VGH19_20645 [Verrucomicrobiae bacterium]
MVKPVFVAPYISPAVITPAEIDRPLFVFPLKDRWIVDLPDVEAPTFVQAVFSPALYDGCEYQTANSKKFQALYRPGMLSGSSRPAGDSAASRIFMDTGACCGNTTAVGGGK